MTCWYVGVKRESAEDPWRRRIGIGVFGGLPTRLFLRTAWSAHGKAKKENRRRFIAMRHQLTTQRELFYGTATTELAQYSWGQTIVWMGYPAGNAAQRVLFQ